MKKNLWWLSVAFWLLMAFLANCGGESFHAADSDPASSAPASASSSASPIPPMACPASKLVIINKTCTDTPPSFCKYKQDCLDSNSPFCYHGVCSDNDPIKKDPCPDNQTSAKGVCYDPWNDDLNCGGFGHQCAKDTHCSKGYCLAKANLAAHLLAETA